MNACAQLVMAFDGCFRELLFQFYEKIQQGCFLESGSGVCRSSFLIQSAFVADSKTVKVETISMCPDLFYGAGVVYSPIAGDVEMITGSFIAQ